MLTRIAYIGIKGLPSKAGADRVVEAIVRGISKEGYIPTVYCSRRIVPPDITIPGVRLVRIWSLPGKHLHAVSLFLFSALHCLFLGHYDLIHLHNVEASFVLPLLRIRYRVISTSHGSAQRNGKWNQLAKTLIAMTELPYMYLSNCATSVSKPLADYYTERYKRPVVYVPNGVDEDEVIDIDSAKTLLSQQGLQPGGYILFAAGRIMPIKGCHLLLEAYRSIVTDLPLVIVGDSSQFPDYAEMLQSLADVRVHFIPFVESKATLFGLLSAARLFIFPSTQEAMSMMLLEAVSVRVPVICSDIPENTSVLPNHMLFFQSGDVDDLRTKLTWALDHPDAMSKQAEEAYVWVITHYRWEKVIYQYEELYGCISVWGRVLWDQFTIDEYACQDNHEGRMTDR